MIDPILSAFKGVESESKIAFFIRVGNGDGSGPANTFPVPSPILIEDLFFPLSPPQSGYGDPRWIQGFKVEYYLKKKKRFAKQQRVKKKSSWQLTARILIRATNGLNFYELELVPR